jgi:hypothetical protein
MKTTHIITNPKKDRSHISARVRSILTLTGIMIAIICSMILLQETNSLAGAEISTPTLVETSNFMNSEMLVNVGSSIWSLR